MDQRAYSKGAGNGQRYDFKRRTPEIIAHFIPSLENMTECQQQKRPGSRKNEFSLNQVYNL
jgi:hypothetical protein